MSTRPPWLAPRAAYVHIPFCAHHCGYCDFAVTAGQDHLIDLYLEALKVDLASHGVYPRDTDHGDKPRGLLMRTLFLGGGTPSHLNLKQLERLFADLERCLPHAADAEVSLEANPDSFDPDKAKSLAEFGVNRISLGVQSFQPHLLRVLERRHEPAHVAPAVAAAKKYNGRVSIDLIFGVPGQTFEEWNEDLRRAIALEPEQISTYGLTFEKGTRLWKQQQQGDVRPLDEDMELRMYRHAMDVLEAAGYAQYEISSFAKRGGECRHNQVYWANEACFGLGVGAAAYVNGTRTLNIRSTQDYIRKVLAGESPVFQSETLPPEDRARETLTLNLRRVDGVERQHFRKQTGFELNELAGSVIQRHVSTGLMVDDGPSVRMTTDGRCVADSIMTDLL